MLRCCKTNGCNLRYWRIAFSKFLRTSVAWRLVLELSIWVGGAYRPTTLDLELVTFPGWFFHPNWLERVTDFLREIHRYGFVVFLQPREKFIRFLFKIVFSLMICKKRLANPHIAGQVSCLDFREFLKLLEKMIQIDIEHFFQMGWNVSKHQLSYIRFRGYFQESFPLSGFWRGTGMLAKEKPQFFNNILSVGRRFITVILSWFFENFPCASNVKWLSDLCF